VLLSGTASGVIAQQPGVVAADAEAELYQRASRRAWSFIDRNYISATGLVRAHDNYPYVTTWDIGSGIAALYAAHELELLNRTEYDLRMARALQTLQELALYDNVAFGRVYSAVNGEMVGRGLNPTRRGYGWSATDLGRLLSVLRIVASKHPQHREAAGAVVARIDRDRVVDGEYLWGEDIDAGGGVRKFREGRIGYEQYAAAGLAVWEMRAEKALPVTNNAAPLTIFGVPLYSDRRGGNRLTSEPFLLMGLEMGFWGDSLEALANRVLAAQEARWEATGRLTMVSEDAVYDPPYHFYYYNVYQDGEEFGVDGAASMRGIRAPRWLSTKAAFAWNVLFPGEYTRRVLAEVDTAHRGERDWHAGLYEGTGRFAGPPNVNTAAVILESALYRKVGHPLLRSGGSPEPRGAEPVPITVRREFQ
jgi:hypothetical protein